MQGQCLSGLCYTPLAWSSNRENSDKPQPDRYLCFFFKGRKSIVTNAFEKKFQKLPKVEKERALTAYRSYERRVIEGSYYEEKK